MKTTHSPRSGQVTRKKGNHDAISVRNIILIGLPGAGKSTIGVILAKIMGMNFIDTDILMQENTGRLLQEIIDKEGAAAFLEIEEKTICSLHATHTVIATGGSVVFSEKAMAHLKTGGIVIYLEISYGEMLHRLKDITTRGIVLNAGQSLREMHDQRIPLYEKYAEIRVDCSDELFERTVENIVHEIQEMRRPS
jgi:shikimate kinase